MKKYMMAVLILVLMLVCVTALAEVVTANTPEEGYTWAFVATTAGATAATLGLVQFFKCPLDKVWKIPTRGFVYILAFGIMLMARQFTAGLLLDDVPLVALNAYLVGAAAMGTYELTFKKVEKPPDGAGG